MQYPSCAHYEQFPQKAKYPPFTPYVAPPPKCTKYDNALTHAKTTQRKRDQKKTNINNNNINNNNNIYNTNNVDNNYDRNDVSLHVAGIGNDNNNDRHATSDGNRAPALSSNERRRPQSAVVQETRGSPPEGARNTGESCITNLYCRDVIPSNY